MTTLAELAEQSRDHSIFSPSSSQTWLNCPGSLVANALAPDKTSFEAAEGTVAHALADEWLRTGRKPDNGRVIEQDGYFIAVDLAMLAYIEQYVDWVQDCPGQMYFEQKVDLSSLFPIPNQKGTADFFSCTMGRLTVRDLKYGKGIKVNARDNTQGMLYALGVFYEWDWFYSFETIDIGICQPRLDHFDSWSISRTDLLAFADLVRERAAAAWNVAADRSPGEKTCQWCKVQKSCPAYLSWFQNLREQAADDAFGTAEMIAVAEAEADVFADEQIILPELSIDACARILTMRGPVMKWFSAIEDRLFAHAQDNDVPGWKVVQALANRTWADPEKARARLLEIGVPEDRVETRSLVSPNQAEEALHGLMHMPKSKARSLLDSHVERKQGNRTLVRADAKGDPVTRHGDVFDEE